MSSIEASEVKKICLACEAGAGSSLMVKNSLIKKAKKAGIEVEIVHSPATQIPADADIVVCHKGLAGVAKSSAPEGSVLIQYLMHPLKYTKCKYNLIVIKMANWN